ncbi:MAG TPA: serine/threonine-protein kinase, partial [Pirellulales bacterium]|nr:serine/threonine-protein kinase [Pirellulales bacterium]
MDASESCRNPVEELAEEFIERRRRGETPTFEEYACKFPHLAEEIRSLFPALVMMEKLGADTGGTEMFNEPALVPSSVGRARLGAPLENLGDFRILREVGRGGMGVVYEAEQESLGRRVALKVVGGHHTLDRGQVRRFEREARSAARLHHTNIVPVFGVGEQDGLHYYVMQFIQGQGLDEVLAELKRLRTVGAGQPTTATTPTVDQALEPDGQAFQPDGVGRAFVPDGQAARLEVRSQAGKPDLRVAESLLSGEFKLGESGQRAQAAGGSEEGHGAAERPKTHSHAERGNEDSSVTLPGKSELSSAGKSEYQYARSVARIGIQVAGALEYANAQGILHRDIKPSNLLLDLKGTAWVTDFGLAKASEGDDLTHTGDIVGTLRYMAPERFRGHCDARADVYSLGLTLYELLALRPAYDESDRQQLIQQVAQQEPAPLRKLNPDVPRDLATIVQKAISREPDHRYPTAAALADDLERFVDDKPIRARRIHLAERLLRWGRRNRMVSSLSAAVLLLLLALAVGSTVSAVWLGKSLRETRAAQADATDKLWGSYLAQARAGRLTRQPGQRFASLRAIQDARKLPLPLGRSLDELRHEAIACLCLPDLKVAREWD